MTKLRVLAEEDLEDDASFAPHAFCREELKEVLSRVHTYLPRSEIKEAWVDKTSPFTKRDSPYFYFHFRDFTWDGTADCSFQAKAKGWEAWLEKNYPEEEPLA